MYTGKLTDPQWRRDRARRANQARNSVDALLSQVQRRLGEFTEEQAGRLCQMADLWRTDYQRGTDQ